MSERADATNWRDLQEFRKTELTESFVLGWQLSADSLRVDVDLRLEPGHAFYDEPRPSEKVCIRPAVLEFPLCETISLAETVGGADNGAVVASLGPGKIGGLCVYDDGVYELSGKFGTVIIHSGRPFLRLTGT